MFSVSDKFPVRSAKADLCGSFKHLSASKKIPVSVFLDPILGQFFGIVDRDFKYEDARKDKHHWDEHDWQILLTSEVLVFYKTGILGRTE